MDHSGPDSDSIFSPSPLTHSRSECVEVGNLMVMSLKLSLPLSKSRPTVPIHHNKYVSVTLKHPRCGPSVITGTLSGPTGVLNIYCTSKQIQYIPQAHHTRAELAKPLDYWWKYKNCVKFLKQFLIFPERSCAASGCHGESENPVLPYLL